MGGIELMMKLLINELVARGHEVTLFSSGDCVTGYAATSLDALPELVAPALVLNRRKVRERAEGRFGYQRMVDDYLALYRALLAQ